MIHNFLVLGLIFGTLFYFGLLTPYYSSNSFPCYDIPYTSNHFVPYFSSFPLYISSDPSTTLDDAFTGSSFVRRPSIVLAITSFPNLISLLRHQHHLGPHYLLFCFLKTQHVYMMFIDHPSNCWPFNPLPSPFTLYDIIFIGSAS